MKLTSYAQSLYELNILKDLNYEEVILEHKNLSRFGRLSTKDFSNLAIRSRELGLRVLLEWDILMTEDIFDEKTSVLKSLLPLVDAIRVQDPGAFEWCLEHTTHSIQFIAENGNHNLCGLQGWVGLSRGRLERIVLSIELSKSSIQDYVQQLHIPCELLGFGRILLFYTPRSLLTPLLSEKVSYNHEISAIAQSEESPHKGFPVVENQHGTFMFHIKEFCLLDYATDLSNMGLAYFRIDQRWIAPSQLREISTLAKDFNQENFTSFKSSYPQELMRGFYLVNKTDVLFPKLKNSRLQKREGNYLGEVLEVEKGSHLAIMIKNPIGLKLHDSIKILHPKGEQIDAKVFWLKNLAFEDVDQIGADEIAMVQFIGGVWVKSQVFHDSSNPS